MVSQLAILHHAMALPMAAASSPWQGPSPSGACKHPSVPPPRELANIRVSLPLGSLQTSECPSPSGACKHPSVPPPRGRPKWPPTPGSHPDNQLSRFILFFSSGDDRHLRHTWWPTTVVKAAGQSGPQICSAAICLRRLPSSSVERFQTFRGVFCLGPSTKDENVPLCRVLNGIVGKCCPSQC